MTAHTTSDTEAMDTITEWFHENTDDDGQWGSACDFIEYAASVVKSTGRDTDPPKPEPLTLAQAAAVGQAVARYWDQMDHDEEDEEPDFVIEVDGIMSEARRPADCKAPGPGLPPFEDFINACGEAWKEYQAEAESVHGSDLPGIRLTHEDWGVEAAMWREWVASNVSIDGHDYRLHAVIGTALVVQRIDDEGNLYGQRAEIEIADTSHVHVY